MQGLVVDVRRFTVSAMYELKSQVPGLEIGVYRG